MLTRDQLNSIPISHGALELMPESLAREHNVLAVSVEGDSLHVVLPAHLADGEVSAVLDRLRFVLNCEITYDTAEESTLAHVIDLHYTASWSTIQNCDRQFRTRCPKHWAELAPTAERQKRWCSVCERHVTFCTSDEELDRLARAGECVAFYDGTAYTDTLGLIEIIE